MKTEPLLFGLTLLLYFLSSIAYHFHLFAGNERARTLANGFCAAGLGVHTAALGVWCTTHELSILRDPGMPFSLVAYFLALVQTALVFARRWAALGSLAMPLAFVAQFYASALTPGSAVHAPPATRLLSPHVIVLLLGFAAFTLAFCLAVLYLTQSRLLKTKQVRGVFKQLPPLESISTAAHWLAAVGFSMLTLGIITGAIAAPHTWGPEWYVHPRALPSLITSVVAWVIYATYMGVSMLLGWRGRRTTYFLIAGFVVVLIAFIASVARPKTVGHQNASVPAARDSFGAALLACRTTAYSFEWESGGVGEWANRTRKSPLPLSDSPTLPLSNASRIRPDGLL